MLWHSSVLPEVGALAVGAASQRLPFRPNLSPGKLITVDGLDGTGKTTLTGGLVQHIASSGIAVVRTRFPTEWMRRSEFFDLVQRQGRLDLVDPVAFEVQYMVDRIQHCSSFIVPALRTGTWVVADRYALSSLGTLLLRLPGLAQAAIAAAFSEAWFKDLCRHLVRPDLSLVLRCDPLAAIARLDCREGELDRGIDSVQYSDLQHRVLELAQANDMTVIDADGSPETVLRACALLVDDLGAQDGRT